MTTEVFRQDNRISNRTPDSKVRINEIRKPKFAMPWAMVLGRFDNDCCVAIIGGRGGIKARFFVSYSDLVSAVKELGK